MATTVSGELSYDELQVIRRDNVGYRYDSSLVKVRLYIEASDALLTWSLEETEHSGERAKVNPLILERQLEKARLWESVQNAVANAALPTVYQPADNWRGE